MTTIENRIEQALLEKLADLKYTCRPDIRDRAALEHNFRQHFEALNRIHLTDAEFTRLLESIVTPDVFAAAKHLPAHKVGRLWKFQLSEVDEWVRAGGADEGSGQSTRENNKGNGSDGFQ